MDRRTDIYSTRQRTRQWADRQTDRQTDILLDKEQDNGHADIQTDLPAGWTDAVKAAQGVDTGSRRFARAPLTLVRVCVAELKTGHCAGLDILVTDSNRRRTANRPLYRSRHTGYRFKQTQNCK